MPTYRQQIEETVDQAIKDGRVQAAMRDQYLQLLASDDKAAEFWASGFMKNRDYTAKTQQLAAQQRQWEAEARAKLEAERSRLGEWEEQVRQEIDRLRAIEAKWPEATAKIAQYEQLLSDYDMIDKVPKLAIDPTQGAKPMPDRPVQPMNEPQYLTKEEGTGYLREVLELQSVAMQFAGQYQSLFGQPLTDNIIGEALAQGHSPQQALQYWRTKYNTDARQATIQAEQQAQAEAALRAQIRAEVLAEVTTNPGAYVPGVPTTGLGQGAIFERYGASRAQQAAQQAGVDWKPEPAPELRPDLAMHQRRVADAVREFQQTYRPDGSPINGGGNR